jgi:hypothetical protein
MIINDLDNKNEILDNDLKTKTNENKAIKEKNKYLEENNKEEKIKINKLIERIDMLNNDIQK